LPELRGSGQALVKSYDMRAGRLCESDQVAVGDGFRRRWRAKEVVASRETENFFFAEILCVLSLGRELSRKNTDTSVVM
jgi:hypothetical protein